MLKHKKNKGLTLLEVMVSLGIATFITTAIYGTLSTARRSWLTGEALLTAQQGARSGLDLMVKEVRLASSVTVGADNRSIRFNIPIDADEDGFIDTQAGVVIYGVDKNAGWRIVYQIDAANNQIIRQVLDASDKEVSQSVVARNINPNKDATLDSQIYPQQLLTSFATRTGGTGSETEAVRIALTTEVNAMEEININPPIRTSLSTFVQLRN